METINHEYYVSLEVAKLLKEAGFKWFINTAYRDGVLMRQGNLLCDNFNGKQYENAARHEFFSAPTLNVVQRWLREIHHLHITIYSSSQESWMYRITEPHQKLEDGVYGEDFNTYEDAQEAGIKKSLEIILHKGD